MKAALPDPLPAVDYDKRAEYDISNGGEELICEDDEAFYPVMENFDNVDAGVECDVPYTSCPAENSSEVYGLPADLIDSLPKAFQEGTIIYIDPAYELYERLNRTRGRAESTGAITDFLDEFPETLAILSSKLYQNGLTFNKNDTAYLQVINREGIDDGKFFSLSANERNKKLPRYYDDSYEAIASVDLALLHCLYRIISHDIELTSQNFKEMDQKLKDSRYVHRSITIYVRDLLKQMGYKQNNGHGVEISVVERLKGFGKVFGIMANDGSDQAEKIAYEVMRFEEYNEKSNTVRFSSPYLHVLALKVLLSGIKDGKPTHSFRIKSSIAKNHGRTDMEAFEIVCAVVKLIEQAGGTGAHIMVKTLLGRCPSLRKKYESTGSWNKHNVLDKAFGKAWKYLGEYTDLSKQYQNIQLPATDAEYIAKCRNLKYVIEITHKGKAET